MWWKSSLCVLSVAVLLAAGASVGFADEQQMISEDDGPRVEHHEWQGNLACTLRFPNPDGPHQGENLLGIPLGVSGVNACGVVEIAAPGATGDDSRHEFTIGPGLESVVGTMQWQAEDTLLDDNLSIYQEVAGMPNLPPRYVSEQGSSPLSFRVDAGFVEENYPPELHQYDFNNVEDSLDLMFRIFAAGDVNVVVQQEFTVTWDLYYGEPAPEDASASPQ